MCAIPTWFWVIKADLDGNAFFSFVHPKKFLYYTAKCRCVIFSVKFSQNPTDASLKKCLDSKLITQLLLLHRIWFGLGIFPVSCYFWLNNIEQQLNRWKSISDMIGRNFYQSRIPVSIIATLS